MASRTPSRSAAGRSASSRGRARAAHSSQERAVAWPGSTNRHPAPISAAAARCARVRASAASAPAASSRGKKPDDVRQDATSPASRSRRAARAGPIVSSFRTETPIARTPAAAKRITSRSNGQRRVVIWLMETGGTVMAWMHELGWSGGHLYGTTGLDDAGSSGAPEGAPNTSRWGGAVGCSLAPRLARRIRGLHPGAARRAPALSPDRTAPPDDRVDPEGEALHALDHSGPEGPEDIPAGSSAHLAAATLRWLLVGQRAGDAPREHLSRGPRRRTPGAFQQADGCPQRQ